MSHTQAASNLDYRVGDHAVPGYKLIRELGRGAMGVVWLAQTDSGFDRALKVINLRQRGGKKEYRGLRTIKQRKLLHGNLLTLIDYWLKDGDGQFIPDSDDLENTDSFFMPVKEYAGPLSLTQTTPQSISATNADPRPTWQSSPPTSRGATMVPHVTMAEAPSSQPPKEADSADAASQGKKPERRPAQLIVAMELGHKTLDDRQKQCQQDKLSGIPVEELLPYMEQAARGLDYLHREGIIHRDIKPQNIMLVGDVAKVCDYGLVVTTDADLRKTSNAFTPLYASPEAVGEQPLNGRTDQYSLAITYVELRTGKSPYTSETAASVYAAKETGKYNLSRIHKSCVRNVLRKALAREPNERFSTCSEFVRELENAEKSHPIILWTAITVAALALIAIGVALLVPGIRERLIPAQPAVNRADSPPNIPDSSNAPVVELKTGASSEGKTLPKPLPQPTAALRDIVTEAHQLRLAGKFEEALTKLDEAKIEVASTDLRHWNYRLERLITEVTSHVADPTAVSAEQWIAWQHQATQLAEQSSGERTDAVQLAAVRLYVDTRLDPHQVKLDNSAGEFARAFSSASQWSKILRDEDQAALNRLRDALRDRLLANAQPLTTEWKENLNVIWSDRDALQILIDRVRRPLKDGNEEGLKSVAADLDDLSGQFVLNATDLQPQLVAIRGELEQHRKQSALAQLRPFLREDFSSAAVRAKFASLLERNADATNAPATKLLRIESDLESGTGMSLAEQRNRLRSALLEIDRSSNTEDRALGDFARYLRARIDMQAYPGRTPEDVKLLVNWPSSTDVDWHTPARASHVAALLVRLADAVLPSQREGELAMLGASSDQISTASTYLDKAASLVGRSAAANGLKAIVTAVGAYQADDAGRWKDVLDLSTMALADWISIKDQSLAARRSAVQFVSAIAAARVKDNHAAAANSAALAAFADLLNRNFHENSPAEADDELLYSMVVTPAIELPLDESDAAHGEKLAAIWIAKARLLERDDSYGLIGPAAAGESKDSYARTIFAANKAYEKARQLSESVTAAAGFSRTLLKLSRSDFLAHRRQNSSLLAALVERYDPQGNSENPSLQLASAWVSWDAAIQESARPRQIEAVSRSLRHYRAVIAATAERDPYALNSLALTAASNAHVRAAYWMPIGPRDLALDNPGANLADKDPAEMSKHEHLRRAVVLAQAAELDGQRRLPEEAYMSDGNALEDLAYYCKLTDNYPDAAKAFENAIQNTGLRSKAYALLSLGRCQYRWSREPALPALTRGERVAKMREAHMTLTAAINAATGEPRDAAEANWWLAQVYAEAGYAGPGGMVSGQPNPLENESLTRLLAAYKANDKRSVAEAELSARMRNYEQAWRLAKTAADLAATSAPQDEVTYRIDSLEIGMELAGYLKQLGPFLPNVRREDLLVELRKGATQFLEQSQRDPSLASRSLALRALIVLASANDGVISLPEGKDTALVTLKKWEPLFRDPQDADKLVEVLLLEANHGEGEGAVSRAEDVAKQIMSDSVKNRALGRVFLTRANLALTAMDKAVAAAKSAKAAGRQATPVNLNLKDVVENYILAEQFMARAKGDDVTKNLARLREQQLLALPNRFEREFVSNLELHRLREFVSEMSIVHRDAAQAAKAWLNLAGFDGELTKPGALPSAARPIAQHLRDLLKPRTLLRDGGLTPDDKQLVETLDRKLAL